MKFKLSSKNAKKISGECKSFKEVHGLPAPQGLRYLPLILRV